MNETLRIQSSRRYGTHSPLRYPGGKAVLAGLFEDIIHDLGLNNVTYVEPYAGGAGAGLALLNQGVIDRLVINDIDPAVNCFWTSITKRSSEFIEALQSVPLDIDEWKRQREIYRRCDASDPMSLGMSFFYLNRTNRSGILTAGVIGGMDQSGNYKIDARFNKETLTRRLEQIGQVSEQIDVTDLDGRNVIQKYASDPNAFLYIDPPYVAAGSRLYLNSFDGRDHSALAAVVKETKKSNWLMTYDNAQLIRELYAEEFQCLLDIHYSAHSHGKAEELVVASESVSRALTDLLASRLKEDALEVG